MNEGWNLSLAREYPRIELRLPVYYKYERNQDEKTILITDFSPFGVRVESDHSLQELITFQFPQFPTQIKGKKRWERKDANQWITGYQFLGLTPEMIEKLKKYMLQNACSYQGF